MELCVLDEYLDQLHAGDPATHADPESIVRLHGQLSRLEAYVTGATGAFDRSANWAPDGARNAAAWLTARCRLPKRRARQVVRRARELAHLPGFARAWAKGEVTGDHIDVAGAARSEATEAAFARDEALLVGQACSLRFDLFAKAMAYWSQLADPDGAEADEQRRRDRRDVYLAQSFQGMWLGRMTLDPISGTIVSEELERLERILFEVDWAEAREELGRDPKPSELARTSAQRRADAMVEMATRSQIAPSDGRRPAPLFSVFVGYETIKGRLCELAGGTPLAPGSLLCWLDEATIERAVFSPPPRVEVSATARLFTGATRRAIELRDRECTNPYCDEPAARCEVDHIVPYSAGGPTTQENGRLLCAKDNRARNGRPPPGD
jgi:hypothetical protein